MTYRVYGVPLFLALAVALGLYGYGQKAERPLSSSSDLAATQEIPVADKTISETRAIAHYICYNSDRGSGLRIWIGFSEDGKAQQVKYQGQAEAMALLFDKEAVQKGRAYPTYIAHYQEIYQGKNNGTYKLTHSGVWDYAQYIRGRDSKLFDFTIDHNAEPYGKTPCF